MMTPRGALRLALRQVRYENRAFRRSPAAAFFTVAFPLLLLGVFEVVLGGEPLSSRGGGDPSTFYVPAVAALSVVTACFTNVAMTVTFDRDQGLLKRVRGTPLPGWAFLFGRVAHATLVALGLVASVAGVGVLLLGAEMPLVSLPAFLVTVSLGAAAFCALGLAMAAAVPNAHAAPALVNAVVLPIYFFSDVFVPLESPPLWVRVLGDAFPVKHLSLALQGLFDPARAPGSLEPLHLGVLALWGLAGAALAARFFSWEPRR